jgi:hypothetical protein
MRRITAVLVGLALAGCFKPTFTKVEPGRPLGQGTVILVGSFTADPPIEQHKVPRDCSGVWVNGRYEPPGKVVFVQETDGNVMAFFTRDLSEPFEAASHKTPSRYDWTYMPLSGPFVVELPRTAGRLHLRGFTYLTNAGSRMFELPAHVDLSSKDRIVYVGEIRVHRGPGRHAEIVNAEGAARRAVRERGLSTVAGAPWTVRLLQPAGRPAVGAEWGSSCMAREGYWGQLF